MKFDIHALSSKLNKVDIELKKINLKENIEGNHENKIKKYGTFLDSKKEMAQLYILFIFFGLHGDIISQMPKSKKYQLNEYYPLQEYDPD